MSINISQAFKRTSANPVDESLTLTKAQMVSTNDNLMPSKYFTICQEDGYIYLYDKSNEVDQTTGKFRKFEGGSGGASDLSDLEDVLLTSLANGQTLAWDSTSEKWVNANMPTVPTKTSDLTNDSGFITKAVNDLVNYYLKSETYSKTEVDAIVTAIKNSRFEAVSTLPTTDIQTNVIYLVPSSDPQTVNAKDEYINLDGTTAGWELIGSTAIDLSGYVTTSDLNTALAAYTTTTDLTALLAAKQDKIQLSTMPAASADYLGKVVQYIGASITGSYTHNYFYECVSDGQSTPTYSWTPVAVQDSGSSYTAGDGIDITNDTISIDPMPAEDMDDVIDELPTGGNIAVTGYVPLGTIIPVFRETAPKFFLICDGSTYNKADYPELAELLLGLTTHSQYEVDGDNTKFKVPDLRGEFLRMTGTNSHALGGNGSNVGVHQEPTMMPQIVSFAGTNFTNGRLQINRDIDINTDSNGDQTYSYIDKSTTRVSLVRTDSENSSSIITKFSVSTGVGRISARPTNTSVLFCIAYKDIYSNPMNDYSTDEKVVGTWVDGKTLYQKTVNFSPTFTLTINNTAQTVLDISALNIDNLIDVVVKRNAYANNAFASVYVDNGSLKIQPLFYALPSGTTAITMPISYITIQYTKV